jgi:hypothetical protein
VETAKAHYYYEGYRTFQPMGVEWAETALLLADEFREGNVYTGRGIKEMADEAYRMLPPGPSHVEGRSHSAAYRQGLLTPTHQEFTATCFSSSLLIFAGCQREIQMSVALEVKPYYGEGLEKFA